MKSSELRIGNWIADRGGKQWQIDHWELKDKVSAAAPILGEGPFGIQYGHPLTEYVDHLQPIPLTKEWLVKFGFELFYTEFDIYGKNGWQVSSTCGDFEKKTGNVVRDGYWRLFVANKGQDRMPKIKYVHELQNLYFSLTGEELVANMS